MFSNAALHWIPNHHKLFKNYDILKSEEKLLIQSGGKGNLAKTHEIMEIIKK